MEEAQNTERCALLMGARSIYVVNGGVCVEHGAKVNAARKDVQMKFKMEECVGSMGQKSKSINAAREDALSMLKMEECARSMVQRSNDAANKDA